MKAQVKAGTMTRYNKYSPARCRMPPPLIRDSLSITVCAIPWSPAPPQPDLRWLATRRGRLV